jgi:hypothetical protein
MRKVNEEGRLLRRITHLRTMLGHAEDDRIVLTLKEFIADTETALVALKPNAERNATLH